MGRSAMSSGCCTILQQAYSGLTQCAEPRMLFSPWGNGR